MSGYSLTMHYWKLCIKNAQSSTPASDSGIITRGTAFEGEPTIDTEDWEGHTGTKTMKLASDRTKASAEPQWEQKFMFGEGVEELWTLLLGLQGASHEFPTPTSRSITGMDGSTTKTVYDWHFYQDLTYPAPLPVATITNGYNSVANSSVIYDNAKMNELELSIDDKGININPKFMSNAPLINQANPALTTASTLSRLGTNGVNVYIADFGTNLSQKTAQQLDAYKFGCIVSSKNTFKTNLEDSICLGDTFGKNELDEGSFENDGEMEIAWSPTVNSVDGSKILIDKWYTGTKNTGTTVTQDNCYQEILIKATSRQLGTTTGQSPTPVYESFDLYLPKVQIDKAWSDLSGDEKKTINIEYSLVSNGMVSPVDVKITSELSALHKEASG